MLWGFFVMGAKIIRGMQISREAYKLGIQTQIKNFLCAIFNILSKPRL